MIIIINCIGMYH